MGVVLSVWRSTGPRWLFTFARSTDHAAEVEQAVRDAAGRAHGVQIDLAAAGAVDTLTTSADEHPS